jgi:hypothetical protein
MENNSKGKIPDDPVLYPGKPDHTTCVAVKVHHYLRKEREHK